MKRFVTRSSRVVRRSVRRPRILLVKDTKQVETGSSSLEKLVDAASEPPPSEIDPPPLSKEPPLLNPFPLLAHTTENVDLAGRLRAYSNTFGVIGALWCSLSIAALAMSPIEDVYKETERTPEFEYTAKHHLVRRPTLVVKAAVAEKQKLHPSSSKNEDNKDKEEGKREAVLVKYLGVPEHYLEDLYVASWSLSFFISAIGIGLSTVVAGIVAATAPAYVKIFVRRHSDVLIALPICQGLSSGFAALGLTIGLDEARGEPVSWIGYIGTIGGAAFIGTAGLRVLKGYKASRSAGKLSLFKDD